MAIRKIKEEGLKKIKEEGAHIKNELQERTLGYIIGALSLVAGLAWNDTIKAFIEYAFPLAKDTLQAKLLYAVAMTLFVGLVTIYLIRFLGKKKEEEKQ